MHLGKKSLVLFILWSMMTFICGSVIGLAQQDGPKAPGPAPQTLQKIVVQGRIAYLDAMGGYYVQGEKPHEEFTIGNQNPKVLEKLAKSGRSVTIEARPYGDLLFIEKIDGKQYQGKREPVFK